MTHDDLRELAARVDAIAAALVLMFDEVSVDIDGRPDRQGLERVACLCGILSETAERALNAIDAANANASIPPPDVAVWDEPRGPR